MGYDAASSVARLGLTRRRLPAAGGRARFLDSTRVNRGEYFATSLRS